MSPLNPPPAEQQLEADSDIWVGLTEATNRLENTADRLEYAIQQLEAELQQTRQTMTNT